ncbi:hypothetical protein FFLO_00005 [Filobasidium floriforme]|uniref:General stress protein FMN-binding split barrel domain-containing protein n=1 Tax=Filobasidium floriforme TaxID=5210 RepID=A0A8K0JSK6_9TREE|nr:uncharacterized protein HD553DRAFT_303226 [Filobasidium floriforme]KAG7580034.1 hypothetical protein FFLO_00005 [Filobasidium floriforme]KAH8090733.1 hypothetical protein HD553DRAFT_303226 [Filobasidium floriforme]
MFIRTALRSTKPINTTRITSFRLINTTSIRMAADDQYSKKSEDQTPALKDRVAEVEAIIKKVGTCSLTTVGTDGSLHSRAMRPASTDKLQPVFIYDNSSHKDEEVKKDSHVNVSFLEPTKGDWISIAGKANTTTDRETVKKYFNPATKAWFGDLGDGVHDGTANDPRVTVLIVKPAEIRYFAQKDSMIGQAVEVATSALTGKVATPGAIRTITGEEAATL